MERHIIHAVEWITFIEQFSASRKMALLGFA